MTHTLPVCISCGADSNHAPLLPFLYQGKEYHICPLHLPILIHKPAQLADRLPGLELLKPPADH